jgi:hypothetical protein
VNPFLEGGAAIMRVRETDRAQRARVFNERMSASAMASADPAVRQLRAGSQLGFSLAPTLSDNAALRSMRSG